MSWWSGRAGRERGWVKGFGWVVAGAVVAAGAIVWWFAQYAYSALNGGGFTVRVESSWGEPATFPNPTADGTHLELAGAVVRFAPDQVTDQAVTTLITARALWAVTFLVTLLVVMLIARLPFITAPFAIPRGYRILLGICFLAAFILLGVAGIAEQSGRDQAVRDLRLGPDYVAASAATFGSTTIMVIGCACSAAAALAGRLWRVGERLTEDSEGLV